MPERKKDMDHLVSAIERFIRSDINEAKRVLEENGVNPNDVAKKGKLFVQGLIQSKLSKSKDQFATRKWRHNSVLKLIDESNSDDPIQEIRERARTMVLRSFENGWSGPPFNPLELAKLHGIDLKPDESIKDASIVSLKKGHFQIQYNPFQKPTRINFSVAHEIAHFLFSDCDLQIRNREEIPKANWELEFLCNIAAAEILLPYAAFANEANSTSLDIESLIALANKYEASLESVFLRFTEVVNKNCAIAIANFVSEESIEIDYFKPSTSSDLVITRGWQLPSDSKLYECTSPGWTARGEYTWEPFKGKRFNVFGIGLPPYKRETKGRVGILFVPAEVAPINKQRSKIVMEIGDATKPRGKGRKIIAQIVNTSGGLGIGFGKSLSKNYPIVKTELEKWVKNKKDFQLGNSNLIKASEEIFVFQMLAQKGLFPKGTEIPLRYTSLKKCLTELAETAKVLNASIHMPQIGAGQAKGDWNIILEMIHDELVTKDLSVSIYVLPGTVYNPKIKSNLTIFREDSTWQTGKLF